MAAPARLIASAHSARARPASRRRAKASATDSETTGPDCPPPIPFTDAPPGVAPENNHRPTREPCGRVAKCAQQEGCPPAHGAFVGFSLIWRGRWVETTGDSFPLSRKY